MSIDLTDEVHDTRIGEMVRVNPRGIRVSEYDIIDLKHDAIDANDEYIATVCERALGELTRCSDEGWYDLAEELVLSRRAEERAYIDSEHDKLVTQYILDRDQGKWEEHAKY